MPVEQATVAPRRSRGLSDIAPQYIAKSGLCTSSEMDSPRGGSIRIRHMTGGGGGGSPSAGHDEGEPRFPRLDQCAHFHYDQVDLPPLQVCLYRDEMKQASNKLYAVQVTSHGASWLVRRSYENFRLLDGQLHRCVYDRRFSELAEFPEEQPGEEVRDLLDSYLSRFSALSGNLLNCGPVLNWLEMDNRGRRLLAADNDDCPINTPAVAAAYSVRRYSAQAVDEISFQVGDMISVIDMPPPEESVWWRGKLGFQVGFFPGACVAVIGDKLPRSLKLPHPMQTSLGMSEPSKPVLKKHGKLIAFFRSFILARPSRRRLKQSGILKERVFGCDLGEHLLNSGHDVPMVLKCCAEFIESHGIVDGIYRLSGVTSNIQKLRNAFDEDRIPALYEDATILQDIHSVASLLKMYFRELPNPLCTYQLYRAFVSAAGAPKQSRLALMRGAVAHLPPPHYRTLNYLMTHLARVAERGHVTGMTARNVAIVWAPNLLRCKELEVGGVAALQGVGIQAVVTEFLICYQDLIFCDKLPALSSLPPILASPKRCRPKSLAISTPTKLLSLEEARARAVGASSKADADYIEVGGGPSQLPAKYHTVIELPRKRAASKRSPLGWRSLFKSGRKSSVGAAGKPSAPCSMVISNQPAALTESDLLHRHRLRPVKSAESLESSPPGLAALDNDSETTMTRQPSSGSISRAGHNRSVSHDSYFDSIDTPVHSRANVRSSLMLELNDEDNAPSSSLDLSEIQLNFDLEESEMRIFSEDETLVSTSVGSTSLASNNSPRICRLRQALPCHKRLPASHPPRARQEDSLCSSVDPSPKKLKTSNASLSPTDSTRSKRSRLEEQLATSGGELRFIDSQSPDNTIVVEIHPTSRYSYSDTETTATPDTPVLPYVTLVDRDSNCSTSPSTPMSLDNAAMTLDLRQPTTPVSAMNTEARMSQSSSLDIPYNRLSAPILTPNSSISGNLTPTIGSTQEQGFDSPSPDLTYPLSQPLFSPSEIYENVVASPSQYQNVTLRSPVQCQDVTLRSPTLTSWTPPGSPVKESLITIKYGKISSPEASLREEQRFEKANVYQNLPSPSDVKSPDDENVYENVEVSSSESPTFGRDSSPPTSRESPEVVYERVKYFRHSVNEVNQLLADPATSPAADDRRESLEDLPYGEPGEAHPECVVGNLIRIDDSPREESRTLEASSSVAETGSDVDDCGSDMAKEILEALDFGRTKRSCSLMEHDSDILDSKWGEVCGILEPEIKQSCYVFEDTERDFSISEIEKRTYDSLVGDIKDGSLVSEREETFLIDMEKERFSPEAISEVSGVEEERKPECAVTEHRESLEEFLSSDPVKRRIESEIGRDIVRERRMRQELEDIRSQKKQAGIKELLSRFEATSPTKSLPSKQESPLVSPTKSAFPSKQDSPLVSPTKSMSPTKHESPLVSPTNSLFTSSKQESQLSSPSNPSSIWEEHKSPSPTKDRPKPITSKPEIKSISPSRRLPKSPSPTKEKRSEFKSVSPTKEFQNANWSDFKSNSPTKSSIFSPSVTKTFPTKTELGDSSPTNKSKSRVPDSPKETFETLISPTNEPFQLASPPKGVFKVTLATGDFQATLPSREDFQRSKDATSEDFETPKLNRRYGDAGSLPPCLRARAAKSARKLNNATSLSGSLDEDRFVAVSNDITRVLTSPDIAAEEDVGLQGVLKPLNATEVDDAQRRARIEKYKEERRCFLREKYRSESFKSEKDEVVLRLKQKTGKVTDEAKCQEDKVVKTPEHKQRFKCPESGQLEAAILEKRDEKFFRIRKLSKSPEKSRPEPITCVTVKERHSSDRMNVRLGKPDAEARKLSDRRYSSPNTKVESSPVRSRVGSSGSSDAHRKPVRSSPTSPTKPVLRPATERRPASFDVVRKETQPPEATRRKSSGSPSYCIKDMAAMFEGRDNIASQSRPPSKQYMSSV